MLFSHFTAVRRMLFSIRPQAPRAMALTSIQLLNREDFEFTSSLRRRSSSPPPPPPLSFEVLLFPPPSAPLASLRRGVSKKRVSPTRCGGTPLSMRSSNCSSMAFQCSLIFSQSTSTPLVCSAMLRESACAQCRWGTSGWGSAGGPVFGGGSAGGPASVNADAAASAAAAAAPVSCLLGCGGRLAAAAATALLSDFFAVSRMRMLYPILTTGGRPARAICVVCSEYPITT
mmetsp:Transcript_3656/g.10496  ORF Transcript_3656/g.10496 Transcript_3656/m.10496 type:complete len:230 (+) Transcript_3656:246-935(+)